MNAIVAAILSFMAWLFGQAVDVESAKAGAAVAAAASSMAEGTTPGPAPKPTPPKPDVCPDCKGTGWIVHGDGHRTPCPCGVEPKAPMRSRSASASPATVSPAEEIPWR